MSGNENFEFAKSVNDQTINSSHIVLRTLLIIHGGAAVALLGFISSIAGSDSLNLGNKIADLTLPLLWFGWGVVATVGAMTFAYFTNLATVGHAFAEAGSSKKRVWGSAKNFCHVVAVLVAFGSIALFLCGMYEVRGAIVTMLRMADTERTQILRPVSTAMRHPITISNY